MKVKLLQEFWSGKLDLPKGTELPIVVPSADGARGNFEGPR